VTNFHAHLGKTGQQRDKRHNQNPFVELGILFKTKGMPQPTDKGKPGGGDGKKRIGGYQQSPRHLAGNAVNRFMALKEHPTDSYQADQQQRASQDNKGQGGDLAIKFD